MSRENIFQGGEYLTPAIAVDAVNGSEKGVTFKHVAAQ